MVQIRFIILINRTMFLILIPEKWHLIPLLTFSVKFIYNKNVAKNKRS